MVLQVLVTLKDAPMDPDGEAAKDILRTKHGFDDFVSVILNHGNYEFEVTRLQILEDGIDLTKE